MDGMTVLDITIKYFNVIVFVMCVLFGMISFFASWIAWREIHHNRNIIRSVIAAYNIIEDTLEKGRTPSGEPDIDPAVVQTVFNSLQEILNAVYGEVTGKPLPSREERARNAKKGLGLGAIRKVLQRKAPVDGGNSERIVPPFVAGDAEQQHGASQP
ncbi:MAG: hypothetical protein V2B18_07010 [Pseudomonadota bacterium]